MTLFLFGLLAGLIRTARIEVSVFERAAASEIGSKLQGSLKDVSVRTDVGPEAIFGDVHQVKIRASHFQTNSLPLFTEPKRSHRGTLRNLSLDLSDFSVGDLHLNRLSAEIPNCCFDLPLAIHDKQFRLSASGTGVGTAVLSSTDLEKFILAKFRDVEKINVTMNHDKITLEGLGRFLIVKTKFRIMAKLTCDDGNSLHLKYAHVSFDGRDTTQELRDAILETLDPIIDLKRDLGLEGAISVQNILMHENFMTVSGPATIPVDPSYTLKKP